MPSVSVISATRSSTPWTWNGNGASPSRCTRSPSSTNCNGQKYELNLIDTPGHVDFNYEVSRSLAACEGAILLVDAFQGVQAQTVHNALLAIEAGLTIIPVVNKIDLPYARTDEVISEMEHSLGIFGEEVLKVSAKAGLGIEELIQAVIERVPDPMVKVSKSGRKHRQTRRDEPLKALVYNSHFDSYKGVIVYIRIMEGDLKPGQKIKLMAGRRNMSFRNWASSVPSHHGPAPAAWPGRVTSLPTSATCAMSASATPSPMPSSRHATPLAGYKAPEADGLQRACIPVDSSEFEDLREALEKLSLNDSSFTFVPETSEGLGFGFRCGFLGMLHREIIQQRIERESGLELVHTAPNVTYEILKKNGRDHQSWIIRRMCPTPARSKSSASRSFASASSCRARTSAT